MERDHVVGFLGVFAPRDQQRALGFQFVHPRDKGVRCHALHDKIDDSLDLGHIGSKLTRAELIADARVTAAIRRSTSALL
jgi:hypothetical protein